MARLGLLRSSGLIAAAAWVLFVCGAHARTLNAEVGEVKTERKVYDDHDGGVPPLEKRLADAQAKAAPRVAILTAEAECRRTNDKECKKVKELKLALKGGDKTKDKDADYDNDYEEEEEPKKEEEKPKKVEAPCRQSVSWSYFLGTVCLPTTPYDVKPAPKKKEEAKGEKKN